MMAPTPNPDKLQKMIDALQADLEDRRSIERELAHMASFSEMAPNPIVETDIHSKVHYINPAAMRVFPTLAAEGKSHAIFHEMGEVLKNLDKDHRTLSTRTLTHNDRIYEQQVSLLDGGPRVRFYFSDITELKRLDQLKSDFVNMVSHELRSPLTTMLASVKMIYDGMLGDLTKHQKEALSLVLKTTQRLARLSNELLDLSKIEAGKMDLQCVSTDLRELIEDVQKNFQPLAYERGLKLKTSIPQDPLVLLIDPDKIVEVFTNLVNNALKFTVQGTVELSAVTTSDGVRCAVSDSGPGIAEKDLPKVFEKFQQLHAPASAKEKGTGLGLTLCKGIVELHGGKIWVESQLGHGTSFLFTLPRRSPPNE